MDYRLMSDDDIIRNLGVQIDKLRIKKQLKATDIEETSGVSRKTLYNFKHGAVAISLKSFIRLLKALGEVDRLQQLFQESETDSQIATTDKSLSKRVRGRQSPGTAFRWGDEE